MVILIEIFVMQIESNQRAGRGCIGVLVQDDRCFILVRHPAEQFLGDQLVHVDIRLVQPPPSYIIDGQPGVGNASGDVIGCHRADFLEDPLTFLVEIVIFPKWVIVVGVDHVADVGTDVV